MQFVHTEVTWRRQSHSFHVFITTTTIYGCFIPCNWKVLSCFR